MHFVWWKFDRIEGDIQREICLCIFNRLLRRMTEHNSLQLSNCPGIGTEGFLSRVFICMKTMNQYRHVGLSMSKGISQVECRLLAYGKDGSNTVS